MKIKSLFLAGLSCLTLGGLFVPTLASQITKTYDVTATSDQESPRYFKGHSVTPVNLVRIAKQGLLKPQGIPSHLSFSTSVKSGKINAESLVQAGIDSGRLPPRVIKNDIYLSQVQLALSRYKYKNRI